MSLGSPALVEILLRLFWIPRGFPRQKCPGFLRGQTFQKVLSFFAPTSQDANCRVRIFCLNTELPFAGHPTLGTARAWLDAGGVPRNPNLVLQECGAGLIPVRIEGVRLTFASPRLIESGPFAPDYLQSVLEILGVSPEQVVGSEWLDHGPGWVGVLLDSAETVLRIRPNSSRHLGRWDIGLVGAQKRFRNRFGIKSIFLPRETNHFAKIQLPEA